MKTRVELVEKLDNAGKTYNIYIKGHQLINLTLESGHELNAEMALSIAKDAAKQQGVSPDKVKIEDITFEEAEPEFN